MSRQEQMDVIAYMTATSGQDRKYFGANGEVSRACKYITLPVAIVCEGDTSTEVELFEDGTIEISGWDGVEGLGDEAGCFSDEEIAKVFDALCNEV